MRQALIDSLMSYTGRKDICVITGDLGFGVLEPLREALGDRFINAGISEQNMISVAAGLAQSGMRPFVYSISPFIYARALEQIRNDICLQDLPVCFIASGAGYGYGNSGPTHHALEDYGIISTLQNINIYIPSFACDMNYIAAMMIESSHPVYLRLGRDESVIDFHHPAFSAYRKLKDGNSGVVLVIGNMAGSIIASCPENLALWSCGVLPVKNIPPELLCSIQDTGMLAVIEDHVSVGGLGEQFCACMLDAGVRQEKFIRFYARGYSNELYGSQEYYRRHNGLNICTIRNKLAEVIGE